MLTLDHVQDILEQSENVNAVKEYAILKGIVEQIILSNAKEGKREFYMHLSANQIKFANKLASEYGVFGCKYVHIDEDSYESMSPDDIDRLYFNIPER